MRNSMAFLSSLLFSAIAFAGGGGGGGVLLTSFSSQSHEIIFARDLDAGSLRIAHGLLENDQWSIQYMEINKHAIENPRVAAAIAKSLREQRWIEIK